MQGYIFWGYFLHNKKGLCHTYMIETAQEKKLVVKELGCLNLERGPAYKAE